MRGLPFFLKRGLIGLVLATLVGAGIMLYVGRSAPSWYHPPDPADEAVAALAERVEYRFIEETQKIRPEDESWTLRVRDDQVNAWLGTRLRDWVAFEQDIAWPDVLGTPQVRVLGEGVQFALPVQISGQQQVVVADLKPTIEADALRLELLDVRIGRFSVADDPVASMMSLVDDLSDADPDAASWRELAEILAGQRPIDPVMELSDGRRVRIEAIVCRPGSVDLTARTLSTGIDDID